MSETQNKTVLETLNVERNSTTVAFVSAEKKRGDKAGEPYYAIDPTITFDTLVAYIGQEDAKNMLLARANVLAQKWMTEACKDEAGNDKSFDKEEFIKYAKEFSARGLTIGELKDEIVRITGEITSLATDLEFLSKPKEEMREIMLGKANRVKELQAAIENRKRKDPEDAVAAS